MIDKKIKEKVMHLIRKITNTDLCFFDYVYNKTFHAVAIQRGNLMPKVHLFRLILSDSDNQFLIYSQVNNEIVEILNDTKTVGIDVYFIVCNLKKTTWHRWKIYHYNYAIRDWEEIKI